MTAVAITGFGLVSPVGTDLAALAALVPGAGLRDHGPLAALPTGPAAGAVDGPDLTSWLKRRKDRKVMARPSVLALAAAGPALTGWTGDPVDLAVFLGVGREPPDSGESEPCLAAAARAGRLDEARLAGPGRDLYPPLLPLQTLPNMALAHISINLGAMGENNAWAGDGAASLRALVAGARAVAEGRAPAALAGGADSLVDLGSARDRLRMGGSGAPGEAAAVLRLEPVGAPGARLQLVVGAEGDDAVVLDPTLLRQAVGDTGAAEGALLTLVACAHVLGGSGPLAVILADPGHPAVSLRVQSLPSA